MGELANPSCWHSSRVTEKAQDLVADQHDPRVSWPGGSVVSKHLDPGPDAPTFAYLRDPSGNQFGVFSPPAA
jgi:predicted enzyme related to lactoylglutathione lyase